MPLPSTLPSAPLAGDALEILHRRLLLRRFGDRLGDRMLRIRVHGGGVFAQRCFVDVRRQQQGVGDAEAALGECAGLVESCRLLFSTRPAHSPRAASASPTPCCCRRTSTKQRCANTPPPWTRILSIRSPRRSPNLRSKSRRWRISRAAPARGAEGNVEGKGIKVVSPGYLREQNIELADKRVEPLQAQGKTVVFVLVDGQLKGAMALADIVRPEAKQAIAALKALNIRCMMLTGDNQATAKWVSDQVGLDEYFAEVLPQDKAAKVKEVQARGVLVAMIGDGVNDAPALAQADVGIAIGAGSDVAVETADIVLVRSNPMDVVAIVQLSCATYRKMIQNLVWATGYNVFAIPLAAGALYAWGVLLTPALGAALMAASTVIVAINARLLRLKKAK